MSRVQLALNMSDINAAFAFNSKMFNSESVDVCCATTPSKSVTLTSKTGCC